MSQHQLADEPDGIMAELGIQEVDRASGKHRTLTLIKPAGIL